MPAIKPANSQVSTTLLMATFVAVQSYLLHLLLGYIISRFWHYGVVAGIALNIVAIFAAYIIADAITKRNLSRTKKIVIAIGVIIATTITTVAVASIMLYLTKLELSNILG